MAAEGHEAVARDGGAGGRARARCALAERPRRTRFPGRLERAADAYLVRRGTGRDDRRRLSVVHRLGPRHVHRAARAVPGDRTARRGRARSSSSGPGAVSEGMLPNFFPDAKSSPEFNSVDASLWYLIAVHEYLAASRGRGTARRRGPIAQKLQAAFGAILTGYARGTRFGIRADDDGLLAAGEPGVQLTWMDAKVGDWVVTPRIGKPVEIQALWINALRIAERVHATQFRACSRRRLDSFERRFWNEAAGCLLRRRRRRPSSPGTADATVPPEPDLRGRRPAVPAPRGGARAPGRRRRRGAALRRRSACARCRRTHPDYRGRYEADRSQRDGAYHQGTVWPYLLGRVRRRLGARARRRSGGEARGARSASWRRCWRTSTRPASAHVSEIADGDAPHTPRRLPVPGLVGGRDPPDRPRHPGARLRQERKPSALMPTATDAACDRRRDADPERVRLARTRGARRTGSAGGPTSPSGSGAPCARTTARDGTAWDSFPHDARALARLPLGRGRPDGHLGPPPVRLLRDRALERADPILKERLFGLTGPAGQPRRGRQGVLLLPRLDAHALLHEGALQVPAARVSVRSGCSRRTGGARRRDAEFELLDTGVFDDDRYFDVFTEYAKASPDDILIRIRVFNRGPEAADAAPAADDLVPQHVVVGPRHAAPAAARRARRDAGLASDRRRQRVLRPARARVRGRARAALHRERNATRSGSGAPRTTRPTSRTASTTTSSTARRTPSTPSASARRPRPATS